MSVGNLGGRPKKWPDRLKLLSGTYRADRQRPEGAVAPAFTGDPPATLSAAEKKEWRAIAPILINMGVLSVADVGTLSRYCCLLVLFRATKRELKADASASGRLVKISAELRSLENTLGLTPMSRSRLTPVQRASTAEEEERERKARLLFGS